MDKRKDITFELWVYKRNKVTVKCGKCFLIPSFQKELPSFLENIQELLTLDCSPLGWLDYGKIFTIKETTEVTKNYLIK